MTTKVLVLNTDSAELLKKALEKYKQDVLVDKQGEFHRDEECVQCEWVLRQLESKFNLFSKD